MARHAAARRAAANPNRFALWAVVVGVALLPAILALGLFVGPDEGQITRLTAASAVVGEIGEPASVPAPKCPESLEPSPQAEIHAFYADGKTTLQDGADPGDILEFREVHNLDGSSSYAWDVSPYYVIEGATVTFRGPTTCFTLKLKPEPTDKLIDGRPVYRVGLQVENAKNVRALLDLNSALTRI